MCPWLLRAGSQDAEFGGTGTKAQIVLYNKAAKSGLDQVNGMCIQKNIHSQAEGAAWGW